MIEASRTLSAPSLDATLVRRRRPSWPTPQASVLSVSAGAGRGWLPSWSGWRGDLRFFAACYAGGLTFFLIMLS